MLNLDKEVYSYEFGIKQINLGYSELNKSMCYISDEIDLGELDKDTYIQLSSNYDTGINGSIEFYIEDSLNSKAILPIEEVEVKNEKIFLGLMTRFAIDTDKEISIYKNGIKIDIDLDDAINAKDGEYVISYTPINPYNVKVNNSKIRVKTILRTYEETCNTPYINSITIKKYKGVNIYANK